MHRTSSFAVAAFLALVSFSAVGCAAGTDASDDANEAAAMTAGPITIGNFLNHPKIKEVRAEVAAVDAAKLTAEKKTRSCDDLEGTVTKASDEGGKIRKLTDAWGASDGDGTTTYYYDASGRLRFVFDVLESAPADDSLTVFETRSYFDASGHLVFQVGKKGRGTTAHPPNMDQAHFVVATPDQFETNILPEAISNPAGLFDDLGACKL
jgi:hypothetical protein